MVLQPWYRRAAAGPAGVPSPGPGEMQQGLLGSPALVLERHAGSAGVPSPGPDRELQGSAGVPSPGPGEPAGVCWGPQPWFWRVCRGLLGSPALVLESYRVCRFCGYSGHN